MAFIGLTVPSGTARLIETLDVPGERKAASQMHVTILYLGKDLPFDIISKAMIATINVCQKTNPFICGVKDVSSFPRNPDDGVPIILPVLSSGLHRLRNSLIEEFTTLGVPFSNKYPDFKPHVSVAFVKDDGFGSYSSPMDGPLTWTASEIIIWGGNKNDELVSINCPFSLGPLEKISRNIVESGM